MLLAFVMAVVLAVVFFKLGVYSVLLALFQLVGKVLFFGTGLFLLVYAGRRVCSGGGEAGAVGRLSGDPRGLPMPGRRVPGRTRRIPQGWGRHAYRRPAASGATSSVH